MNTMNPNALNLWVLGTALGGSFGHAYIGLAIASGLTFVLSIFQR